MFGNLILFLNHINYNISIINNVNYIYLLIPAKHGFVPFVYDFHLARYVP